MNFRLKVAAWFAFSFLVMVLVLIFTAHEHLDEELREDRWDRSHPEFPEWIIHGSYTNEEVHDILGELIYVWLWVGIPLVLASVGAGYFIALRSVRPIRQINRELAALQPRSVRQGITLPEQDEELATLVRHINDLLGRVGHSYDEMAEFSGRVAHELRTPLTLLRMRIESAAPALPEEFSEDMQEEIRRLSQLVERSLLAAKAEGGKLEVNIGDVDLSAMLDDLQEGYSLLLAGRAIPLEWEVEEGLACQSDPEILRQILHNLLSNAVRHGTGRVRVRARYGRAGSRITVWISNFTGPPNRTVTGVGMGLRLVRSLSVVLGDAHFSNRAIGRSYSVRLILPGSRRDPSS